MIIFIYYLSKSIKPYFVINMVYIYDEWIRNVDYFHKTQILALQKNRLIKIVPLPKLIVYIENAIRIFDEKNTNSKPDTTIENVKTGYDYEIYCCEIFRQSGWDANVTKGSGDQGADIIIEKLDRRVVVQCKFYNKAVGNKAVQEVIGAKSFYKANEALVVCSSTFTPSARKLATSSGVNLIHHNEISRWCSV